MTDSSLVVEKSVRSVFVGNIPYEATDEKLRDIFGQVGPVLSFKLMYDRETGKPKGYGFCEYKDQETALSAMRNLNGYEIGGRSLRVDNACTEKSRMEMQSLMMGSVVESPFGPEVDSDKAPEAISNAVASLPPEQMYELMRQMKLCVRNNPAEARTMLMNNPQLAYALLQAQVVMRIIDPKVAVQILHGSRDPVEPILPNAQNDVSLPPASGPMINGGGPQNSAAPPPLPPSAPSSGPGPLLRPANPSHQSGPGPVPYSGQPSQPPAPVPPPNRNNFPAGVDFDLRHVGAPARGPGPLSSDMDMRMPPGMGLPPSGGPGPDNYRQQPMDTGRYGRDYDQRDRYRDAPPPRDRDTRDAYGRGDRDRDIRPNRDMRDPRDSARGGMDRDRDKDYRSNASNDSSTRDPRARVMTQNQDKDFRSIPPNSTPNPVPAPSRGSIANTNLPQALAGQDQEKANLIMQVLQLSDEQIRMLPPEQQNSILQLKDQIQRSSH